ncbi:MAG: MerR family DNA-binding transcriptional regulator [Alphaproteobacteria bacterium]
MQMSPRDTQDQSSDQADRKESWSIGELSEEFELTHRSIRYYEDQGLVTPKRDGQTRIFTYRDRARIALICRGKRLGFSIAEIRDFLTLYDTGDKQVKQMHYLLGSVSGRIDALEQQLTDVQTTLTELQHIRRAITAHLEQAGEAPVKTDLNDNPDSKDQR